MASATQRKKMIILNIVKTSKCSLNISKMGVKHLMVSNDVVLVELTHLLSKKYKDIEACCLFCTSGFVCSKTFLIYLGYQVRGLVLCSIV